MAIDFPNSPSPGASFTANSKTWTFTDGKWMLNVSTGGVTGATGPAGTVSVGTVTSGETGAVVNAGTSTAAVLDITLPIGATGPQGGVGDTGPQGGVGATGPQGGVGATGPQGIQGIQGTAGTNGTNGAPGTNGTNGTNGTVGATGPAGPAGSTSYQASSVVNGGASLSWNGAGWWDFYGEVDFQGQMYYINPGPSSATEGVVRISTGQLKKNSASGVSLRSYKEDIVPMENALEQLSLLQPRNFRFKEEILVPDEPYDVFNRRTQLQYGFVMEEVRDAVPDLVMHKSPDGTEHEAMYWKESGMIALAVKAIQELSAQVAELKSELDALR